MPHPRRQSRKPTPRTLPDPSPTPTDLLVWRIRDLYRAKKFNPRSAAIVSAAARKHPRSPDILLAVAEYRQQAARDKWLRTQLRLPPSSRWGKPLPSKTARERAIRRVLALDPTNARAWENLASLLDITARYPEAAIAARNAMKYGDDPDATALLARILAQQDHRAEARRLARRVTNSTSEFARNTAKEVLAGEWRPWNYDEIQRERRYRNALKKNPRNARVWHRLAAFLDIESSINDVSRLDEAAAAARQAVRHGGTPRSLALLARILALQNHRAEAIRVANHPRLTKATSGWAKRVALAVREGKWFPKPTKKSKRRATDFANQ